MKGAFVLAAKKSSKSNKTEHVLNLLSGVKSDGNENDVSAAKNSGGAKAKKRPVTPVLKVAQIHDEEISNTIQNALDEQLKQDTTAAEAPSEKTGEQTLPKEEPAAVQDEPLAAQSKEEQTQDVAAASPQSQEVQSVEQGSFREKPEVANVRDALADAMKEELTAQKFSAGSKEAMEINRPVHPNEVSVDDINVMTSELVNVMEIIVDECVEKYIDMFKVCRCPRCNADVKALALTKLPSKYVVLSRDTYSPIMNFYKEQYSTIVRNQIIFACSVIKKKPRHKGFRNEY